MIRKLERVVKKAVEEFMHFEQEAYPLISSVHQVTQHSEIITLRFTTIENENFVISIQQL